MKNIVMLISYPNRMNKNSQNIIFDGLNKELNNLMLLDIPNLYTRNYQTRFNRIIVLIQYLILAIRGIYYTPPKGVIISMNFIVGAIVGLICKLFFIKRKIISVNMIVSDKSKSYTLIRNIIYNLALKGEFYFTVNSIHLKDFYRSKGIKFNDNQCYILHDAISLEYPQDEYVDCNGNIFCGGENGRDWETMIQVAESNMDLSFVFVARKAYFNFQIPRNVKIYFDTDSDLFYKLLKDASIVVMPLLHDAPAGLTVIIRAALLRKVIIATDTVSMKNYIVDGKTGFLVPKKNAEKISIILRNLLNDKLLMKNIGESVFYEVQKYSFSNYLSTIINIIKTVKQL